MDVQDLCASGFPFCGTYVEMEGLHADCMAVMIDGEKKPRYCWGPASYKSYAV